MCSRSFFHPSVLVSDPTVEITSSPVSSNFFTGLQLNLTCQATIADIQGTTPFLTLTWMKDGEQLENGDRVMITQVSQSDNVYEQSVVFESLETVDESSYSCFANLSVIAGDFVRNTSSDVVRQQISIESKC